MARALLLALTCAAAASAARYVDYSVVKMPAYGGAGDYEAPRDAAAAAQPSEDYHGHSPDAPASLDYKYEEEPRVKTEKPTKDSEDTEVWRKPGRKQRGLMRPMDTASGEVVNKYERDEEEVPKFRSSHRYPKHRSRLKNDTPARDEESPPKRPIKYSRDRKDDVSDIDRKDYFHVDKEDFPDDKSKEFDEEVKFVNEATTRRANRRKPRDRHVKRKSSDLETYEEEQDPDRRLKGDVKENTRRPRPPEARVRDRYRPELDDEDEDPIKVQPLNKLKQKSYEDYDDYYDMKRVYSIKNKLPSLLRRTSERVFPPTPTSFLDVLRTNRRMMSPFTLPDFDEPAPTHTTRSGPTFGIIPISRTTTTTTTTTKTTTKIKPKTTKNIKITTTTKSKVITTFVKKLNASALSLAEKSRLSIMKKDQRKEGQHIEPPTKKPPVLLQVTRQLPTVVMVEPPSSMAPWMRASEVADESPEHLEKVKKLMRHKLVADAKNMRDLTDNWDDMVCDYIDTAMLDNTGTALRPPQGFFAWFSLLLCAFLFMCDTC